MSRLKNFENLYLGKIPEHDTKACEAWKEYNSHVDEWIEQARNIGLAVSPRMYMEGVAINYGTTMQEMKKHGRC